MPSKCIFCNERIMKNATICFACQAKGPYMDEYPEAAEYACKGIKSTGKPCQKWAKKGKPYCTYHKSQFKEESK